MILYLKDSKTSTQKLLDTINNFSNVAGYKINLQKPFNVSTMNKLRKNAKIISFTIFLKRNQTPRCKLNKGCE
jgi:hypothetical protein